MEYRMLDAQTKLSLLGFGCMRFPLQSDGRIDEVEAEKMIDIAIAQGVNYIDTAFPYHQGASEPFVGRVLKKYDRSKYYLATKMPLWNIDTLAQAKEMFENQLERLDVEYVDFYLLHALDLAKWNKVKRLKIIEYCLELKKQGKIRQFGFSFHDEYKVFEAICNDHQWDFAQIQYNYMDRDIQAGDAGYQLCERLQIPLIVMEPIKGGALANLHADLKKILNEYAPDQSLSSWALRWVASKPNIKVILSGMSTLNQVEDNLKTCNNFKALNPTEDDLINEVTKLLKARLKNGCTACSYCMPCPSNVDIPKNFKIWNDYALYGNKKQATKAYFEQLELAQDANQCIQCGKCEKMCPQKIAIREDLTQLHEDLSTKVST